MIDPKVKRYDSMGFENELGLYVRWSDFDAVAQERDQLRNLLNEWSRNDEHWTSDERDSFHRRVSAYLGEG
jgi:hypothetical protein